MVHFLQLVLVVENLPAAGEIRGEKGGADVVFGIFEKLDGGFDQLVEVKGADRAGHADRDARVAVAEDGGEGDGEQGRFLHGVVEIIHHRLFKSRKPYILNSFLYAKRIRKIVNVLACAGKMNKRLEMGKL